jgi:hypothetical protein
MYRGDGPVCRSDPVPSTVVWVADHGPRPAANSVARRDGAPHRGMNYQPADGRLWLGASSALSDPRSGCLLRQYIHSPRSLAWHSRSPHICTLTIAERACGAADRLDPAGMPGPYRGDRRAAPSPHPCVLHGVLQCGAHAPIVG